MRNKRKAPRRPMRYSAWVALKGDIQHGCTISDISESGARIDVESSDLVPEHFLLLLSRNGAVRRECRVIWRQPQQVGVTFEQRLAPDERAGLVPAKDAQAEVSAHSDPATTPSA